MKKWIKLLTIASMSFVLVGLKKDEKTLSDIQDSLKSNKELSLEFEQINYRKMRNKKRVSKGYAYFSKNSQFRWVLTEPKKVEMVYDGSKFAKLNPDNKTGMMFNNSSGEFRKFGELVSIVMDIEKLLERFEIETLKNNKSIAFIKLRPKKNSNIEFVELNILHKHKYVSSVKIIYKGGNYWHVNFSPPSKDPLPKNAFKIPDDGSYRFKTIQ